MIYFLLTETRWLHFLSFGILWKQKKRKHNL
jgi:hypothetical protein